MIPQIPFLFKLPSGNALFAPEAPQETSLILIVFVFSIFPEES